MTEQVYNPEGAEIPVEPPKPKDNGLKADKRVGGLYVKEKNGKTYLLGKLWYGQVELRIAALPNKDKRNDTHPDYIVVLNEVIKHQFRTRKRPIWARIHVEKHSG